MIRNLVLGAALLLGAAAGPLTTVAAGAQAPGASASALSLSPGTAVEDPSGAVLGRVEQVIVADGQPRQVLVRTPGIAGARTQLKSLPVAALRPKGDRLVTPLRRAEFDALPSVERR